MAILSEEYIFETKGTVHFLKRSTSLPGEFQVTAIVAQAQT